MKHIKRGRGPSFMGGIMGIAMAVFGVLWTFIAASMGAGPFALFGVVIICIAVAEAVYNFKNASGNNRYSEYDIVDSDEEPDPLNEKYGKVQNVQKEQKPQQGENRFCPYCGTKVADDYTYCNNCGKKLP